MRVATEVASGDRGGECSDSLPVLCFARPGDDQSRKLMQGVFCFLGRDRETGAAAEALFVEPGR